LLGKVDALAAWHLAQLDVVKYSGPLQLRKGGRMWKDQTVHIREEDGGLAEDTMYSILSGFSFRHT